MSHVEIAKKICDVCRVVHSHNAEILIHRKLKDIDPDKTITGYGLCEEDQKLFDNGYLALVEANVLDSEISKEGKVTRENADRTGKVAHVKRTIFNELFSTQIDNELPLVFVEPEVIEMLAKLPVGE